MRRIWLNGGVLLGGCLAVLASGCAGGAEAGRLRTVTVVGEGEVSVPPDTFVLDAGAEVRDASLDKALAELEAASQRIIGVAREFPIDQKLTHTTRFTVSPNYDTDTYALKNYEVQQRIEIYLSDPSRGQELTLAVLHAGANNVLVDFVAREGAQAREDLARQAAVHDARRRAELVAAALGERVGSALEIGRPEEEAYRGGGSQLFQSNQTPRTLTWIAPAEIVTQVRVYVRFALVGTGER